MANRWHVAATSFVLAAIVCVPALSIASGDKPAPEFTGIVVDRDTGQPIEGAYVMASYVIRTTGIHMSTLLCVKSRGMYTGPDGTFRFPIDKPDNLSPYTADAIKVGYFPAGFEMSREGKDFVGGQKMNLKLVLARQDADQPTWRLGSEFTSCRHANTRADAAAAAQYNRILLKEADRIPISRDARDALRQIVLDLESRGTEAPMKGDR